MIKKWIFPQVPDPGVIKNLSESIRINPALAALLVQRNIRTYEEAHTFFRPKLSQLHSPWLMKNMEEAVTEVIQALDAKQKILVYGDYDVDGTTSVAMMVSFLRDILSYPQVEFYIPDRYKEGYGISRMGIDFALENNFALMIALDCGTKALEQLKYAHEKGLKTLVCDHHLPAPELPLTDALLNPKQPDCKYPFKELSGCGVGFKLIQAVAERKKILPQRIWPLLDLVAVSTCCDIVPIVGENRILVYHGLNLLNTHPRPGIEWIREKSGSDKKEFSVEDVVFLLGPKINAAGRIMHGSGASDLLLAKEHSETLNDLGKVLYQNNDSRRELDKKITDEALQILKADSAFPQRKTTVVFHPEWHKGVVGIVASRLIETYYKPTIVLTESNGMATGSARTIKGVDIHAAIESCKELLENYGGHTHAAGLTLPLENLEAFKQRFENSVDHTITWDEMVPELELDGILHLHQITSKFYSILKQMAPFGPGNMNPVFASGRVKMDRPGAVMKDVHLRLYLRDAEKESPVFQAVAFKQAHWLPLLEQATDFEVAYSIQENTWKGNTTLQLDIKDIRIAPN